ncbi:MAG TPA: mycoredoxin [Actinomycetes bacterium]|nr:mycoredoxin [Actinomycetes bacterium]
MPTMSLTMYSTPWCGYCHRLKRQLSDEGITFEDVDLDRDAEAARFVAGVNGGNHTVPTVRFADGSTLTNPSLAQVTTRLAEVEGARQT